VELTVAGEKVRATTGGRPLDTAQPLLIFLHGSSQNRTTWAMQQRYFSHHGWSVLAPDLPAHGLSGGALLDSIEDMASWVGELIEAAGFGTAAIIGHSMGSLIALDLAGSQPERVTKLVLTGTTAAMRVHDALQSAADANERRAHEMVVGWSLTQRSALGGHPTPGLWLHGQALQTSLNAGDEVLANDLRACHNYDGALAAAAAVQCPVLVVVGQEDRMTSPAGAAELAAALGDRATVAPIHDAGHAMMLERPDAVLDAFIGFLG
jgi:pimeloyl-ACP methyl ester carboxylesterase